MRLRWNLTECCFEAEFQDFQADLDAVKAAGFKTTGAPNWTWYSFKTGPLDKLRKNKPASGLTILEDALEHYNRLKEEEAKREALLSELKAAKKAIKNKEEPVDTAIPEGQEFGYINFPETEKKQFKLEYIPPVWGGPFCIICKDPVYFYEMQNPPTCLWCEKQLDLQPEMF